MSYDTRSLNLPCYGGPYDGQTKNVGQVAEELGVNKPGGYRVFRSECNNHPLAPEKVLVFMPD